MANIAILRTTREVAEIQNGTGLSIAIAVNEKDIRSLHALILGPPETPYEFGFFEFKVKFTDDYPNTAPLVTCISTNGGSCRFNPNIYADGKVCLSILGTWEGENGEQWSTAQGLESVLISIQSLLSANPYENEPGFEGTRSTNIQAEAYAAKVRHEALRVAVIQRLEIILGISDPDNIPYQRLKQFRALGKYPGNVRPDEDREGQDDGDAKENNKENSSPEDTDESKLEDNTDLFADLCKSRFLWYYDAYLRSVFHGSRNVKEGSKFRLTDFEHTGNQMDGKYNYKSLEDRLERIRAALDSQVDAWIHDGARASLEDHGPAANLRGQFDQVSEHHKRSTSQSAIELSLVDKNVFVWHLTFFGQHGTDLAGAIINARIYFPPNFPTVQPRVNILTPLFHHRISAARTAKGHVLCYFPTKPHDVGNHIEAITAAIQEENPRYDPCTLVNPEAAQLLWGGNEQKKVYKRKLRRSVQDSMENMDDF